jgi:phage head maturation protease
MRTREEAAEARRAAYEVMARNGEIPTALRNRSAEVQLRGIGPQGLTETRRSDPVPANYRFEMVTKDGKDYFKVGGSASTVDTPYTMWDIFGDYDEVVKLGSFDVTLSSNPDTIFVVNHSGASMARTNGTLFLKADPNLDDTALLNPSREDVKILRAGIEDGQFTEQSFKFRIDEGWWSEDFTRFEIAAADLHRGDVGPVNFGANPYTDIGARSAKEIYREVSGMPMGAQVAIYERLHTQLVSQQRAQDGIAGALAVGQEVRSAEARLKAAMAQR